MIQVGDNVTVEAKVIAVSANGVTLLQTGSGEKFYVSENDIMNDNKDWTEHYKQRFGRVY